MVRADDQHHGKGGVTLCPAAKIFVDQSKFQFCAMLLDRQKEMKNGRRSEIVVIKNLVTLIVPAGQIFILRLELPRYEESASTRRTSKTVQKTNS